MAANMISMKILKPSPPIPGTKWHYSVSAVWTLERRDGIDRRAHPLFDSQRCRGEQKLVLAKTLGRFGKALEVEVVEDRRAQSDQREPMQREELFA